MTQSPAEAPICHIVMWDVRGATPAEKLASAEKVRREFEALRGQIPGMIRLEIGMDVSRIDYACDMVLLTEFTSAAALRDYATHPLHLQARDHLEGIRIARHQVDYPIPAHAEVAE